MVVEAEVLENFSSELETDSGERGYEVSNEDSVLNREIADSQGTSSIVIPSVF